MQENNGLDVKAVIQLETNDELYKLVDFLNRNLKSYGIIFGLSKIKDKMKITIYELKH